MSDTTPLDRPISKAGHLITSFVTFPIFAGTESQIATMIVNRLPPLSQGTSHLIVTPNMHHLALLETSAKLAACYRRASMVLADGWPVVRLANRVGAKLPARATGSGLIEELTRVPHEGARIFLIGGSTVESFEGASANFAARGWQVSGNHLPPGWLAIPGNREQLVQEIRDATPDVVAIGIGSPKQEILATELMDCGVDAVFIGIGAGIDFLSGHRWRAPRVFRASGLEWLHRIGSEPTRLLGRYLSDVIPFLRVARRSLR